MHSYYPAGGRINEEFLDSLFWSEAIAPRPLSSRRAPDRRAYAQTVNWQPYGGAG